MSIAQGQIPQKSGFPCTLRAVLGSHGIVVKVQPPPFFLRGIALNHLLFSGNNQFQSNNRLID